MQQRYITRSAYDVAKGTDLMHRLSPNATTYLTPTGARIGQSHDTIAVRSQLAF